MPDDVLYTTRWNELTREPVGGHRWLSEEEAHRAFESGKGIIEVVDAAARDADGTPRPRWVIGTSANGRARVRFFTPGGSVWRNIDYDEIDGRLWRWISVTYTYPDLDNRYMQGQALQIVKEKFQPDGTGTVRHDVKTEPEVDVYTMSDVPVAGFWLDRPRFGDWAALTDPEYGLPARDVT
ncbi:MULTISPECIES: hypothetical protein [unclassified Actinotalea]|uniref:hypothetical protein n=1 Tax=unclassified Actinotalea TaxID=2638618 RepID=UPI0015F6C412|nr:MULTISPECIES: hypothetical protein [unclassified Actinotalea]